MPWSYDSSSRPRDTSISVEEELALHTEQHLPWRHKLQRLWRLLRDRATA